MILRRIKPDGSVDVQETTDDKARIEDYAASVFVFNKRDGLENAKEQWRYEVDRSAEEEAERAEAAKAEAARIDALTTEEKAAEIAPIIQGLVSQAAMKKTEFEVSGASSASALAQARTWLADQKTELYEKYGYEEEV